MIVAGAIIMGTVKYTGYKTYYTKGYDNDGMVYYYDYYTETYKDHYTGLLAGSPIMGAGVILTTACLIRAHTLNKKADQNTVFTSPLYENEFKLKNGASLATGVDLLKDNKHNNPTLGLGLRYNF